MLKYKTSRLTEAIDSYFDTVLSEADPAVTVIPSGDSETEANKSTLEQFISTVFSDHSEDISNVNIDYNGNDVEILVDVTDKSKMHSLVDLYKSKFELEGNENKAWSNVTVEEVNALDYPCFVIKLTLGSDSVDEEVLHTYSLDDLYQITEGHDDARVVLEDIESNVRIDDLLDLINSKNFRTDDEVLDFMLSDEVDSLRSSDETFESESLTEDIGSTKREIPLKLSPVEHDITNTADMIGKYVKIRGNYHEIVDVKDEGKGLYTVSFSASTDGKTPGGEFEQGTADQLSKLQLYQELKEKEQLKEDEDDWDDDYDDDYEESIQSIVEDFFYEKGIDMFWDRDGYMSLACLESTNYAVVGFEDGEFDDLSEDEMKEAVINKIKEGFNYYKSDLEDPEYVEECELTDEQIKAAKSDIAKALGDTNESEKLTEQVVPASELGFKHQELAKIEDEVALISKLKGEDPGNELYTDLLGCFDKAIEILKDAINEDPVGTVVGKDDVAVEFDSDASLGDNNEESVSDIDSEDIPEKDPNLEEPNEDEEEM